jgi:enediyne biosynthesis protein E4
VSWGLGFADFDNSGLASLLIVNGHIYPEIDNVPGEPPYREPITLFRNKGDKTFEDVANAAGLNDEPPQSRRGVAFGDLDNDGDIDLVAFNEDGAPSFILNETKNSNHRVMFKLLGTTSNRAAIGTRVTIQSGDIRQMQEVKAGQSYLSCNDFRLHFGIGNVTKLNSVEVRWPTGQIITLKDLATDRLYTITEGQGIISTAELPLRN